MPIEHRSQLRLVLMALWRLVAGIAFIALLLYVPAGTTAYWEAWVYIVLLFTPVLVVGLILLLRDPELLERRMTLREQESSQRTVILLSTIVLLLIYIVPGFDRRFGWSDVAPIVVLVSDVLILGGYGLFALTLRENRFASRVVELQAEQQVVQTGPYRLVRHPMYFAIAVMFILSPLALGSWWGLLVSAAFPLVLVGRIRGEEELLRRKLPGYEDYCQRVRYRLIPLIW
jgi:protein-S-isoprenylcysteine O-methyltransferase Ste14